MRLLLLCAASACALAGQAAADTYRATAAEIEHAAAVLTVIPEDRADIDVTVTPSERLPTPSVRLTGDGVVIDGGLRNRFRGCSTAFGRTHVRISGIGAVAREDFPRIVIRAPRRLDLEIGGAVYATVGPSHGGRVTLNGCGDTTIGDAAGALAVTLNGSGDVDARRVDGALTATLNGSGSMRIRRAGAEAALRLNGSGDMAVDAVEGAVEGRLNGSGGLRAGAGGAGARVVLNGSGDVQVGSLRGFLEAELFGSGGIRAGAAGAGARLRLDGSGDIDAGAVTGPLEVDLQGSGSVDVASVEGERADLSLSSSGDIAVHGGRVERLDVRNSGSGDVRFTGAAGVTRATLHSSGDVTIGDAGRVEQLIDSGSGSINLGR